MKNFLTVPSWKIRGKERIAFDHWNYFIVQILYIAGIECNSKFYYFCFLHYYNILATSSFTIWRWTDGWAKGSKEFFSMLLWNPKYNILFKCDHIFFIQILIAYKYQVLWKNFKTCKQFYYLYSCFIPICLSICQPSLGFSYMRSLILVNS